MKISIKFKLLPIIVNSFIFRIFSTSSGVFSFFRFFVKRHQYTRNDINTPDFKPIFPLVIRLPFLFVILFHLSFLRVRIVDPFFPPFFSSVKVRSVAVLTIKSFVTSYKKLSGTSEMLWFSQILFYPNHGISNQPCSPSTFVYLLSIGIVL